MRDLNAGPEKPTPGPIHREPYGMLRVYVLRESITCRLLLSLMHHRRGCFSCARESSPRTCRLIQLRSLSYTGLKKEAMGDGRQESKIYLNNHSHYKLIMPDMQRAGLISLPVKNRQLRKIDFLFQLTNLMAQFFVLRHLAFQKVVRNFRFLFDAFGRQEIQIGHFIA